MRTPAFGVLRLARPAAFHALGAVTIMAPSHPASSPPTSVPLSPIARHPRRASRPAVLDLSLDRSMSSSPTPPTEALLPTKTYRPTSPGPSKPGGPMIYSMLPPSLALFVETNLGLLLVAVAQLFFTLMGVTVRYFLSSTDISTLTLIAVRMAISTAFCIGTLLVMRDPHPILGPPEIRHLLWARGLFGFWSLFSGYQALRNLTVSDNLIIQFLVPSLTAVFGYLYLGESLTWREILGGACCLVGVTFVSRPPFLFGGHGNHSALPPDENASMPDAGKSPSEDRNHLIGVAWGLSCMFASSLACKSRIARFSGVRGRARRGRIEA